MDNIMEVMVLKVVDETHDGILSLGVLRKITSHLQKDRQDQKPLWRAEVFQQLHPFNQKTTGRKNFRME